jgi:hypothetical protein
MLARVHSDMMLPRAVPVVPIRELLSLFCIGLASWLLVSGVFAAAVWEIGSAPEGRALFAHLDVAVQSPNIVPALLVLVTPPGFVLRHAELLTAILLVLGVVGAIWLTAAAELRTETASVRAGHSNWQSLATP